MLFKFLPHCVIYFNSGGSTPAKGCLSFSLDINIKVAIKKN